jgi:hypothetical protein
MQPMDIRWIRTPVLFGLGLSATLAAAAAGCGQGGQTSDAVYVPSPNAKLPTTAAPGAPATGGAAPTTTTTAGSTTPAPTAAVKAEGWGTLKGRIVFNGDPPQRKVLQEKGKAVKDPEICAKDAPILSERLVVDSGTKGVKNAFVYLMRPTAVNEEAKKAVASSKVEFDQKGCLFIPHAVAVMTGVPVVLKSSDPTSHNVNFQLRALTSNQTIAPGSKPFEVTPSSPERTPGPVSCSIHPWMLSYWMVLDNPYYAVTDDQGNFEIKNVPAGTQKVTVWQEAVGYVTKGSGDDVNIKPNDTTTQDFTIDPSKVRPEA